MRRLVAVLATLSVLPASAVPQRFCEDVAVSLEAAAIGELRVGMPMDVVLRFYKEHGASLTFDKYMKRWQGLIRDVASRPGSDCAVGILVHLTSGGSYESSEIRPLYTGP